MSHICRQSSTNSAPRTTITASTPNQRQQCLGGVSGDDHNGERDSYELIEMDTSQILEKHYLCEVCKRGFPRHSNVRMHMRKHGTVAALARSDEASPTTTMSRQQRYSCPHPTCSRHKGHDKFQPLKTEMSLKNHYRRSHCAKLYQCTKCKGKKFSVQADLRTHEKHCGHDWRCSCGSTFLRKDKRKRHIVHNPGHKPVDADEGSNTADTEGRPGNSTELPSSSYNSKAEGV